MGIAVALAVLAAMPCVAQNCAAQTLIGTVTPKEGRLAASAMQQRMFTGDAYRYGGRDPEISQWLVRAGAWGRCVVAAAPDASRAYVAGQADPALVPVFNTCLRRSGDWTRHLRAPAGAMRTAAITDALRSPVD